MGSITGQSVAQRAVIDRGPASERIGVHEAGPLFHRSRLREPSGARDWIGPLQLFQAVSVHTVGSGCRVEAVRPDGWWSGAPASSAV